MDNIIPVRACCTAVSVSRAALHIGAHIVQTAGGPKIIISLLKPAVLL